MYSYGINVGLRDVVFIWSRLNAKEICVLWRDEEERGKEKRGVFLGRWKVGSLTSSSVNEVGPLRSQADCKLGAAPSGTSVRVFIIYLIPRRLYRRSFMEPLRRL